MKYTFRGLVILDYNEEYKDLTLPIHEEYGLPNFNMCKFITEDYKLLANFFDTIHRHQLGEDVVLEDVEQW